MHTHVTILYHLTILAYALEIVSLYVRGHLLDALIVLGLFISWTVAVIYMTVMEVEGFESLEEQND